MIDLLYSLNLILIASCENGVEVASIISNIAEIERIEEAL